MSRKFILLFCCVTFPLLVSCKNKPVENNSGTQNNNVYMLVGTYNSESSRGIHVYDFNPETGDMKFVSQISDVSNPSYLAISTDEKYVYSVCENDKKEAAAAAFSFDKKTGSLKLINVEQTNGSGPCYVAVNKGNNFVTTANYSGGSLSVFPINKDGSLHPVSQVFGFQEKDANAIVSHVHTTFFSPDQKYLFATDLGKDKIYRYNVETSADSGLFLKNQTVVADLEKGSGPRHLTFSPDNRFLYCINELSGKLTAFQYNDGALKAIQYIASDTTSGTDKKGSADIHMTPDGKFLYSSNRLKADGIAIFSVNSDGTLKSIGYQPTGIHPRNFIITPNGKFLLVASRDSNNICVFAINKNTGLLENTGKEIKIQKPVCLKFISK